MKKFHILALLLVALTLTGCNTMRGIGQDIQKAGETLEDAAKKK